jgi:putative transposase
VTKCRSNVFDGSAKDRLRKIFAKVCTRFEASIVGISEEGNHLPLPVENQHKLPVMAIANSLKGLSSRILQKESPDSEETAIKRRSVITFVLCGF